MDVPETATEFLEVSFLFHDLRVNEVILFIILSFSWTDKSCPGSDILVRIELTLLITDSIRQD